MTEQGARTVFLTDLMKLDGSLFVYLHGVFDKILTTNLISQAVGHRGGQFLETLDSRVLVVDSFWVVKSCLEGPDCSLSRIAPAAEVFRR